MTTNYPITEADAIAALAVAASEPVTHAIDGALVLAGAYPAGWAVQHLDLEKYEPRPRRRKGTVTLADTASLLAYIDRQVADDDRVHYKPILPDTIARRWPASGPPVYLQPQQFKAVAIFNDHDSDGAGWRDHCAHLQLIATDEWQAWAAANRRWSTAQDFAEHIEEWRHTIMNPPTADLLDMVRNFRATTKVQFGDEVVDKSGDRALTWTTETTTAAGRSGKLEIPDVFELALAPFEGAEPRSLTARFRFRVGDGTAAFGVVLDQPKLVAKAAFDAEVAKLHAAGLTTMVGSLT